MEKKVQFSITVSKLNVALIILNFLSLSIGKWCERTDNK